MNACTHTTSIADVEPNTPEGCQECLAAGDSCLFQVRSGELVISRDTNTSGNNVQGFVDSYNAIMNVLKKSLRPDPKAGPNPPGPSPICSCELSFSPGMSCISER